MNKKNIAKILVLGLVSAVFVLLMINYTKNKEKSYEYALKQEIGVSDNCYYTDNAYCKVNGKEVMVDNYYEIEARK